MEPLLYKVEEVAAMLGLCRAKAWELIRTKQIQSVKIGKSRRIAREDLEQYIQQLREKGENSGVDSGTASNEERAAMLWKYLVWLKKNGGTKDRIEITELAIGHLTESEDWLMDLGPKEAKMMDAFLASIRETQGD